MTEPKTYDVVITRHYKVPLCEASDKAAIAKIEALFQQNREDVLCNEKTERQAKIQIDVDA